MFEDAREYIKAASPESSVYIGCDSIRYKRDGKWFARYSTVVVIHINSKNGGRIFHNSVAMPDYGNLRQRLLAEVGMAIEAFDAVQDVLGDRHVEIHLDINPSPEHASNVAVKEALGWVKGLGIEPKIKPSSWCATHAADWAVRELYH